MTTPNPFDIRVLIRGDTKLGDAPLVIGIGPGFSAGDNAHAVIETNRGYHLGRVIWRGAAAPAVSRLAAPSATWLLLAKSSAKLTARQCARRSPDWCAACFIAAFKSARTSRLATLIRVVKRSIVARFQTRRGPLAEGLSRRFSTRTRGSEILPRDKPAIKSNR